MEAGNSVMQTPNSRSLVVFDLLGFDGASQVAQTVKNPPAMRETWVRSLGWEDSLEEGVATHSSILAWEIPRQRSLAVTVHRVAKSWTRLSN